MRLELTPLSECLAMRHRKNPKDHDLDELTASIIRFGFCDPPTIDEASKTMVEGHGRCEALEKLRIDGEKPPERIEVRKGIWYVPVLRGVSFKSERERDAYLIAHNKLPEAGGWDDQLLYEMLKEFSDDEIDGLGFTVDELDDLLAPNEDSPGHETNVGGHVRTIGAFHSIRPPREMTSDDWTLHLGDCLEGLRQLAPDSVDALITDPPGGGEFMGQDWDSDKGGRDKWIAWLASIMSECMRVMKPGAHGIVWAFPRTQHWTMTALEDAGFEIRDVIYHAHGQGFPKSLDLSKAIDAKLGAKREVVGKQNAPGQQLQDMSVDDDNAEHHAWTGDVLGPAVTEQAKKFTGMGTALKPAVEPWIVVRKPLDGTAAENALAHGTGGINIAATRIGDEERYNGPSGGSPDDGAVYELGMRGRGDGTTAIGRWPAHFVLSHLAACSQVEKENSDELVWQCADGCAVAILESQQPGTSRYYYVAKPSRAETEAGLDELPASTGGEATDRKDGSAGLNSPRAGGGRLGGRKNIHPTKKSIALMRWFVRLIGPPKIGAVLPTILDPFTGSGTTGLAALVEGFRFVGYEQKPEYHTIAVARLRSIIEDPRQLDDDQSDADDVQLPDGLEER